MKRLQRYPRFLASTGNFLDFVDFTHSFMPLQHSWFFSHFTSCGSSKGDQVTFLMNIWVSYEDSLVRMLNCVNTHLTSSFFFFKYGCNLLNFRSCPSASCQILFQKHPHCLLQVAARKQCAAMHLPCPCSARQHTAVHGAEAVPVLCRCTDSDVFVHCSLMATTPRAYYGFWMKQTQRPKLTEQGWDSECVSF